MKRSMTDWPRDEGLVAFGKPHGGTYRGWFFPKDPSQTFPAQEPPSLVPFFAGISLCSSSGLEFLAISKSSHLCIQDSKDCNKGEQHVNHHRVRAVHQAAAWTREDHDHHLHPWGESNPDLVQAGLVGTAQSLHKAAPQRG